MSVNSGCSDLRANSAGWGANGKSPPEGRKAPGGGKSAAGLIPLDASEKNSEPGTAGELPGSVVPDAPVTNENIN